MGPLSTRTRSTWKPCIAAVHRVPARPSFKEILEALERLRPQFVQFLDAVRQMPQGTWVNQHFAFNAELHSALREAGVPIVFLCRDPRDCVLSMANFLISREGERVTRWRGA